MQNQGHQLTLMSPRYSWIASRVHMEAPFNRVSPVLSTFHSRPVLCNSILENTFQYCIVLL